MREALVALDQRPQIQRRQLAPAHHDPAVDDAGVHLRAAAQQQRTNRVMHGAASKRQGVQIKQHQVGTHAHGQVADVAALEMVKKRCEAEGIEVVGPTDHTIFKSIYFFDPSGHRLELATWTTTPEQLARMKAVGPAMVEEWSRTRQPPRHTSWLHEKEFSGT